MHFHWKKPEWLKEAMFLPTSKWLSDAVVVVTLSPPAVLDPYLEPGCRQSCVLLRVRKCSKHPHRIKGLQGKDTGQWNVLQLKLPYISGLVWNSLESVKPQVNSRHTPALVSKNGRARRILSLIFSKLTCRQSLKATFPLFLFNIHKCVGVRVNFKTCKISLCLR